MKTFPMDRIVPVGPEHYEGWDPLYMAYADFYRVRQTDEMRETVWEWLMDPYHDLEGLVALDGAGAAIGLAHFRPFPRPLRAATAGFLDDLFVRPQDRGSGAAQALMGAVFDIGRERGWVSVRWLTAEDNYRARAVYDRVAKRSRFLTYETELA